MCRRFKNVSSASFLSYIISKDLKALFSIECWETIELSGKVEMFYFVLSSKEALATRGC